MYLATNLLTDTPQVGTRHQLAAHWSESNRNTLLYPFLIDAVFEVLAEGLTAVTVEEVLMLPVATS